MKIELHAISWNEERFLPLFLNHYSWVNKIILWDNNSSDDTIKIALRDSRVEVRSYDTLGCQDNQRMTLLKNNCWKWTDSDWIIICDIDELLWSPLGIATFLIDYPSIDIWRATGYNMVSEHYPNYDAPIIDQCKNGFRSVGYDKCFLFRPNIKDINYNHGCHVCEPMGFVHSPNICQSPELYCLHYHFLTIEGIIQRYARYAARMSKSDKDHKWGYHYLKSEETLRSEFDIVLKASTSIIDVVKQ